MLKLVVAAMILSTIGCSQKQGPTDQQRVCEMLVDHIVGDFAKDLYSHEEELFEGCIKRSKGGETESIKLCVRVRDRHIQGIKEEIYEKRKMHTEECLGIK